MARRTQVTLIDDVDGTEATTTLGFGLDGVTYEIDLNEENATKLREDFAQWTEHGRRTSGRARRGTGAVRSSETKRIRQWAHENGLEVSDRGRISSEVRQAYAAATAKN
ncbi:Lsr2 family protein [Brachybacterium sp. J144]|uniref:histone-like nucleoid-structuring protein Lsr2 n=1 Tax=Brachybacterium sp. J144 TaxID=3116487 RepID=UPI000CD0F127|nr:Lsr2 family protein [Brachybacterium sp. J144]MEE1652108.1 Lsr2 family protein [Brachybacterium sp. J144]